MSPIDPPEPLRKAGVLLSLALLAPGCARDRGQITPTTTGTDLSAMPRGRMTPLPFPGSSLAHSAQPVSGGPTSDPGTSVASGGAVAR